ncbi:hypothetical protein ACWEOZ_11175 [Actinoplanes sp. NPDC004185]
MLSPTVRSWASRGRLRNGPALPEIQAALAGNPLATLNGDELRRLVILLNRALGTTPSQG